MDGNAGDDTTSDDHVEEIEFDSGSYFTLGDCEIVNLFSLAYALIVRCKLIENWFISIQIQIRYCQSVVRLYMNVIVFFALLWLICVRFELWFCFLEHAAGNALITNIRF